MIKANDGSIFAMKACKALKICHAYPTFSEPQKHLGLQVILKITVKAFFENIALKIWQDKCIEYRASVLIVMKRETHIGKLEGNL